MYKSNNHMGNIQCDTDDQGIKHNRGKEVDQSHDDADDRKDC